MNEHLRPKGSPFSFAPKTPVIAPPPGNCFVRFITAHAKASIRRRSPIEIARELWPNDHISIALLERATTAPAMTTVSGWAQELAPRLVVDFTEALHGQSAAADLFAESLKLTFGRAAQLSVPGFAVNVGTRTGAFVAEGAPIPVFKPTAAAVTLDLHKVAAIFDLTRELIEGSNAEPMIRNLAGHALGRVLDEVLFDANPGDAARPPGLRNGVAAIAPTTGLDAWGSFVDDISKLADAVAPVAGSAPIAFIGSPGRMIRAGVMAGGGRFGNAVFLASAAVVNDLLAVATAALVCAIDTPEIEASNVATVQEQDTPTSPLLSGTPVRSLWQTDTIGFKARQPVTWALRNPAGFAWMTPTGW